MVIYIGNLVNFQETLKRQIQKQTRREYFLKNVCRKHIGILKIKPRGTLFLLKKKKIERANEREATETSSLWLFWHVSKDVKKEYGRFPFGMP
jgi:hypothetical protein